MANGGPPAPETPPTGPEVQGHGQPPATPEPLTPEQQVAAQAEAAAAPELGQAETKPEEGLQEVADADQAEPQAVGAGGGEPLEGPPEAAAATPDEERQRELERLAGNIGELADDRENLGQQAPQAGTETLREAPPQPAQAAEAAPAQQDPMEAYLNRLNNMPPNQLQRSHDRLDKMIKTKTRLLNNTYDDLRAQQFENEIAALETQKEITEDVMQERNIEVTTNGATTTQQTNAERQQVMEQEAREFAAIQKMTPEQITAKKGELEASRDYLNDRSQNAPDPKDRQAAKDALVKVRGQLKIVEGVAEGKTGEKEKTDLEQEEKQREGEYTQTERELASVADLETFLQGDEKELKKAQKDVRNKQEEIDKAPDDETRKTKQAELVNLLKQANEISDRLKADREALKAAQKREREEKGLEQKADEQTVRIMSIDEFNQLPSSDRTKYFVDLADAIEKPETATVGELRQKLKDGENLTFKESGQLVRELSDSFFKKGGTKDMELLQLALNSQPELAQAVLNRVTQRQEIQNAIQEKFPSNWQKVLKFANNNKSWLLILLAILAAGVALPVAGAVGIAAGKTGLGIASKIA